MGCVPVLIGDGLHQPFEPEIDWSTFAVRVPESDIPSLHHILAAISNTTISAMQVRACVCMCVYDEGVCGWWG